MGTILPLASPWAVSAFRVCASQVLLAVGFMGAGTSATALNREPVFSRAGWWCNVLSTPTDYLDAALVGGVSARRRVAMAIPDHQSLMLPVLIASSKGEVRIGSVVDELAGQLALTSDERSELLPSGKQTVFSNRVHWAKSYLSKRISSRLPAVGTSRSPRVERLF